MFLRRFSLFAVLYILPVLKQAQQKVTELGLRETGEPQKAFWDSICIRVSFKAVLLSNESEWRGK